MRKRQHPLFSSRVSTWYFLRQAMFFVALSALFLTALDAYSQAPRSITVTGLVTDALLGETVPGVNIYIKGNPTYGTVTDINGQFSLLVQGEQDILVFSFIGFEPQEIRVGDKRFFEVALSMGAVELDDVVVVGYAKQRKESVVGAISSASGEDLKRMNVSEVSNSLTGMVTGLVTIQQTSLPGGAGTGMGGSSEGNNQATNIFIRGQSSWNAGQPLILVDGIERRMEEVDPNDIKSISVLKDASATAVFGVKGADGVILITSKRGTLGKPKLTFDGQHTTSMVSNISSPLNSYDANRLKNQAIYNEVAVRPDAWAFYRPEEILNYYKTQEYPDYFPDTDWQSLMLRDAASSYRFNGNISGGTKFVKYFGSLGYMHEGGILKGEDVGQGYSSNFSNDRFNFRSNFDFQFTATTQVSLNLSGNFAAMTDPGAGDNNIRSMRGIYGMPPDLYPVQYSDGTYANNISFEYTNPYVEANFNGLDRATRSQVFTDIKLEQKLDFITEGLLFATTVSYDNDMWSRGPQAGNYPQAYKWINPEIIYAQTPSDSAAATVWTIPTRQHGYDFVPTPTNYSSESMGAVSRQLYYQIAMSYDRSFGKHTVTGLALMSRQERATGSGFLSLREDWVGRTTYNYDNRYFMEVNAAYNGSEKFDKNYRFGLFPSIAAGWMISNEDFFMNALPWWSTFKVRYSHGKVGSDAGIARWLYVNSWSRGNGYLWFGQPPGPTGYPTTFEGEVANPDIHWETAIKRNLGIETGFWEDKLLFTFEYFRDNRSDMLIAANARTSNDIVGAPLPAGNVGKSETYGYEMDIAYRQQFETGFGFTTRLAFASAIDKTIYRDDPPLRPDYQKREGYPIGQTTSFVNTGIMQSWDDVYSSVLFQSNSNVLPGDNTFIDFNADGIIDANDIIPNGYPNRPQYSYTYTLGINYKGISITTMLYGVFNVTTYQGYYGVFPGGYSLAYPWMMNESWSPELGNTLGASNQAIRFLSDGPSRGTYDFLDGSYLRLKNLEVSYQIPRRFFGTSGIDNARIYFTAYNPLMLWTKEKWREDREAPALSRIGDDIINNTAYPLMKRFTFGIAMGL